MSKKKGTVTRVGKGQYSYYIQIDTMDGFYFNTKYEPKCGTGDVVGIEFNKKDDKRGNVQKVTILEKNSKGYDPAPKGGSGGTVVSSDRNESIVFQSSRKDALVFLTLLLEQAAFATKGAAGTKEEQLTLKLDELTAAFYADAIDPSKSDALAGAAEEAEEDKEDEFEEDDDEEQGDFDDEWDD